MCATPYAAVDVRNSLRCCGCAHNGHAPGLINDAAEAREAREGSTPARGIIAVVGVRLDLTHVDVADVVLAQQRTDHRGIGTGVQRLHVFEALCDSSIAVPEAFVG